MAGYADARRSGRQFHDPQPGVLWLSKLMGPDSQGTENQLPLEYVRSCRILRDIVASRGAAGELGT